MESGNEYHLKKHSIKIFGHATSITLEDIYWHYLKALAQRQRCTLQTLIEKVDKVRRGNLSSALRVFVLKAVDENSHRPILTSFYEE